MHIVDSDAFLTLSHESQLLYYHLGMRADDRGYVDNVKKIMTQLSVPPIYLTELINKRFILQREKGLILIKAWRINNSINEAYFNETKYYKDFRGIEIEPNDAYTEKKEAEGETLKKGVGGDIELTTNDIRFKTNIINSKKEIIDKENVESEEYVEIDWDNL